MVISHRRHIDGVDYDNIFKFPLRQWTLGEIPNLLSGNGHCGFDSHGGSHLNTKENMKILGNIPKQHFHVACSGGSDSMVLVDFLRRYPRNSFDILHFNHGTECCQEAEDFIKAYCEKNSIELHLGKIGRNRKKNESQEEYWRNCRYSFLKKFSDEPILMAHHLKDCIETWVMTSLTGNPRLIPYHNPKFNIFRPMLLVSKAEIEGWIERHHVEYVLDRSNLDTSITRNYVRSIMLKDVYHVSPGIEKIIRKKIMNKIITGIET